VIWDEREVEVSVRSSLERWSGQRRLEQVGDAGGGHLQEEANVGRAGDEESRQWPPG
jgi:hypothetical protein